MKALIKKIEELNTSVRITLITDKSKDIEHLKRYTASPVTLEIKELKQSRTLTQNAYLWSLLNSIAVELNKFQEKPITADELYFGFLKDYGLSF